MKMPNPVNSTSIAKPAAPGRRRLLYTAVAGGAVAAGLGLARCNEAGRGAESSSLAGLWSLSFEVPDQPALRMLTFAGRPLLLNFWATWCPPCVEEFPLLDRFFQQNSGKGWQVLALAADQAKAVGAFLQRIPVHFPVALAGLEGITLSKSLGNSGGGLPFSLVLGSSGQVLQRKIGRISPDELERWSALG